MNRACFNETLLLIAGKYANPDGCIRGSQAGFNETLLLIAGKYPFAPITDASGITVLQ